MSTNSIKILKGLQGAKAEFDKTFDGESCALMLSDIDKSFYKLSGMSELQPEYKQAIQLYNELASYASVEGWLVELGSRTQLPEKGAHIDKSKLPHRWYRW